MTNISDEHAPATDELYSSAYFASHCGLPYERNEFWTRFFSTVADHIVRDLAPSTVLDAGCAMGFLVEALVDRGVDAVGVDISDYAISQGRPDVRERLRTGSVLEPFDRRFDLITCIEVIEHLDPRAAERLVENLCMHSDDVLLSSTPSDYKEETHINVNPPEHWAELFARHGFFRDVEYDASYLAVWAMRFRRQRDPVPRLVRDYERVLWRLRDEATQRNQVIVEQMKRIDALVASGNTEQIAQLEPEVARLSHELGAQQRMYMQTMEELKAAERTVRSWEASGAARVVRQLQHAAARAAPQGTKRKTALRKLLRAGLILHDQGPTGLRRAISDRHSAELKAAAEVQRQYDRWRHLNEPGWAALKHMRQVNRSWVYRPLVSVLMPTYNPDAAWVEAAIDSVVDQAYENWELCIADDGSSRPDVKRVLELAAATDPRVRVTFRPVNGGIAAASASALELAQGEYIALLDHDDVLRPHALHRVVEYLQATPETDVVYSDEDVLEPDGTRSRPFFKPDWSPSLLLSVNYVCHLLVARRELVEGAGGFRPGFDGSQDHDLVLRVSEQARHIGHIADVLYTWRQVPGSVALEPDAKMYAYASGKKAVEDALRRREQPGRVEVSPELGRYQVRLAIEDTPHVAIIIPTRDRVALLRECIDSIERVSSYRNWSITLVDNDSADPDTLAYLERTPHQVVRHPGYFNYSRLINVGRRHVDAPYLLTLNNDTLVASADWLEALIEQAQAPDAGVVGGRLLFPDGRPQHEGIGLGNVGVGFIATNLDAGWLGRVVREVGAVTGACQLVKTSVFDEVGGYDETVHVAFNDVDFCLRVRAAGYRIVYTPYAELVHQESASRGRLSPDADVELVWDRWGTKGGLADPYMSPHLRGLNPLVLRLGPLASDR